MALLILVPKVIISFSWEADEAEEAEGEPGVGRVRRGGRSGAPGSPGTPVFFASTPPADVATWMCLFLGTPNA